MKKILVILLSLLLLFGAGLSVFATGDEAADDEIILFYDDETEDEAADIDDIGNQIGDAVGGAADAAASALEEAGGILDGILGEVLPGDGGFITDAVDSIANSVNVAGLIADIDRVDGRPVRVWDSANILGSEDVEKLGIQYDELVAKYNFDFALITISGLTYGQLRDAADDIYDYAGYGIGENHDGVLLLINMDGPDGNSCWITTTGEGIAAINDYCIETLLYDVFGSALESHNFYKVGKLFGTHSAKMLAAARKGNPYSESHTYFAARILNLNWVGAILLAVAIGAVVALVGRSKSRKAVEHAVRANNSASNYTVGGVALSGQNDVFLYNNVSRVRRQTESSSSSRSGGGGGGGVHTSSSGTSHGGGGRHF